MAGLDDVAERKEWVEAINSVIAFEGTGAADDILDGVVAAARRSGAKVPFAAHTAYVNTIPPDQQPPYPGNRELENKVRAAIRWNAAAIVLKANKESSELGGHIASFQSAATLYATGFTHFWHGAGDPARPLRPDLLRPRLPVADDGVRANRGDGAEGLPARHRCRWPRPVQRKKDELTPY